MLTRRVVARILSGIALVGVLGLPTLHAQAAPKGSTGKCTDGTFTSAKNKQGACSAHGGVATWFADTKPAKPARASAPAPAPAPPAPKGPPAGATGKCTDGTFTKAKTQQGACSSHGGVAQWFATAGPATPAPGPARPAPGPARPSPAAAPAPAPVPAAAPAGAPADATALCNDGTYSKSQHRSGTCSQHKGVKQWLKQLPPQ